MGRQRVLTVFKYTVYALLVANVFAFLYTANLTGTGDHKAVDQVGWLLMLGVFEYETRRAGGGALVFRPVPLAIEFVGYGLALYAWGRYASGREWLDFGNASVWLLIAAMIWLDLLRPVHAGSHGFRVRAAVKALLYAATFACAIAWGVRGEALDFWDAALWILCFFGIELNILRIETAR